MRESFGQHPPDWERIPANAELEQDPGRNATYSEISRDHSQTDSHSDNN